MTNLPAGALTARLTGSIFDLLADVDGDGVPNTQVAEGVRITLRPSVPQLTGQGGITLLARDITVPISVSGSVDLTLLAVDDPQYSPRGWGWDVDIRVPGRVPQKVSRLALTAGEWELGQIFSVPQLSGALTVPGGGSAPDLSRVYERLNALEARPAPSGSLDEDAVRDVVDAEMGPFVATAVAQATALTSIYDDSMVTAPLSGDMTLQVPEAGATYAIDLAGDATLTLTAAHQGVSVALDVVTHGHKLTVTDGPSITTDGLSAMVRSRSVWRYATAAPAGASTPATPTPVPEPKDTTAPTFTGTVTVGTIGADRVQLTLSQRAVDAHDGDALTYQASVDAGKTWGACSDSGTTLTLAGLTPETTYPAPRVRALDAAGNISPVLTATKGFKTTVKMGALDTYALSKNPLYFFPGDQGKATYFGRGVWYSGETPNGEFVKGTWDGPAIGTLEKSWHLDATRAGRILGYMTSLGPATQASAALTIQIAAFPANYGSRDIFGMAATLLGYDLKFWSEDGVTVKGSWGDYQIPNAGAWLGKTHVIGVDWTKGGTAEHYIDGEPVFSFTAHGDLEKGTYVGNDRYVVNVGGLYMDDVLLGDDGHYQYAQSALSA